MKKLLLLSLSVLAAIVIIPTASIIAAPVSIDDKHYVSLDNSKIIPLETPHNWKMTSSEFEMIHADTHEYNVWHNFIKKTRKCDITHKIRTEVWYCDLHNHTKSEVSLEETIHSHNHS